MANQKIYSIEVQGDFLNKQVQAKPMHSIAELIWNSLDADATLIEIKEETYGTGKQRIIIADNGAGFTHFEAPSLFGNLGGSWKNLAGQSKGKQRFLHGSEGKGRLKAFSLGRVVDWDVCYKDGTCFKQFTVSMLHDSLREVRITEPVPAKENRTGVRCIISELHKTYEFLNSEHTVQDLSEIFATYLNSYKDILINLPAGKLDVSVAITSIKQLSLGMIQDGDIEYPIELEIIEWKNATDRAVYLCNEAGLPLLQSDLRVQVPGLNYSAYLKSAYISKLSRDGTLGLAEMNPTLIEVMTRVKDAIKTFYRESGAEKAQSLVGRWKEEQVYPYKNEPQNLVEKIEREVFDIVAVNVNNFLPDFDTSPQKGKKLQLRMLRQAIEKSPEELQLILTEVLDLPEKKQKEFARLLQETSLSAIISASKVVSDRLKFIEGLDALLFNDDEKENLQERTQLHRLLAENTWIFGEEFFLSVDDQSLTEVLKKHLVAIGSDTVVDQPVKRVDGRRGIVDLMLTRSIPCHRQNEMEHLVIELKRPTVKIGASELTQVESYAFAVAQDERFNGADTRWTFWVISNDMDDHARRKAKQANMQAGLIHQSDDKRINIWAKTWSEVLQANRHRLKLFQQSLEINADRDGSLTFLKETYANILGEKDDSSNVSAKESDL
ncbi:ATP-binding protein [Methylotenera mobilis]|uniref:DNA mismatch repair protein n=1 Tax=Methylotenera mobilis (strain JLW8 / ATCC BAA-1282 / DSM 17540) TaxID=583345 RepID=C6WSP5_METML|nr:ATP-binding protein [Methylotenera mobilis]ACT47137.1 conserved hypothetical protein [Methylotenera mobilis JLW8]